MDTANVLSEFSDRLGRSADLTYTAEYTVVDSRNVVLVQEPPRAALIAGDERAIFLPDSLLVCDTGECQRAPLPAGEGIAAADAGLVAGVAGAGFVTPELALGLVAAAALVPGTDVDTSEREFAGQEALCADVTGVDEAAQDVEGTEAPIQSFSICVTEAGLLASFSGTTANGEQAAIELVKYEASADPAAFDPPKGAEVVDVGDLAAVQD
jgi:hypothetical protein